MLPNNSIFDSYLDLANSIARPVWPPAMTPVTEAIGRPSVPKL
jgi:hypothetical protein